MGNRAERIERAEARAERAAERAAEADAAFDAQPAHRIPFGQPILVGHHSQRRHERDLARLRASARRAADAHADARDAEHKARNAGHAVYVTDDDATVALRAKVDRLEAAHAALVEHNRAHRDAPVAGPFDTTDGLRHPAWVLTNSRARIKHAREQLAKAEAHAQRVAETGGADDALASGDGWVLTDDVADGRVRFTFDGKPDAETRATLKANGFRWAPSAGAWQRQDTANGLAVAKRVAATLKGADDE